SATPLAPGSRIPTCSGSWSIPTTCRRSSTRPRRPSAAGAGSSGGGNGAPPATATTHGFGAEAGLLADPPGRPQAWHGVLIDVTDLKERALLASESGLRPRDPVSRPGVPRD